MIDYSENLSGTNYFISDQGRITQVLINLISNAIKFTPEGTVRVTVDQKLIHGDSYLEFKVIDTG